MIQRAPQNMQGGWGTLGYPHQGSLGSPYPQPWPQQSLSGLGSPFETRDLTAAMHRLAAAIEKFNERQGK